MKARFWGTRGSIAKAGPSTVRFGGNTSCVELRSNQDTLVILDCGTGAHGLGVSLMEAAKGKPLRGHILISHTHWDHIQGIPFFAPLFAPGNEWDIYAPRGLGPSLKETLAGQMQYTYFPVSLETLGATIRYHDLVEGVFEIDDVKVRTHYLNHPALTLGYRIEADNVSVVYACDHEPFSRDYALGHGEMGDQDLRHVSFLKHADLAIHDAQYTDQEYAQKVGWGHTPMNCAIDMCRKAGVRKLALTHHDPMRNDDELEALIQDVQVKLAELKSPIEVFAAEEGMTIELIPEPGQDTIGERRKFSAKSDVQDALPRHSVLIAATHPDNIATIIAALAPDNLPVTVVSKNENVSDVFINETPSLVVADDHGGIDDAIALCTQLRNLEKDSREKTPIIMISARENHEKFDKTGITDWLVPPFTKEYAKTRLHAWVIRGACRWKRAGLTTHEDDRLAALKRINILDTQKEERFDRITRIAAKLFDVPIALVSFVDNDRQWFKSCVGLDARETPRDQAFCAHAILSKDALIVQDTLLDDRFAQNPLVTGGPKIRFYAGYPIADANGFNLGTLCIIDTRPRDLSDEQVLQLRDLAGILEEQLLMPVSSST